MSFYPETNYFSVTKIGPRIKLVSSSIVICFSTVKTNYSMAKLDVRTKLYLQLFIVL